ncbi:MAG: ATP-binding protein [Rhodospirillaceae bacterium]
MSFRLKTILGIAAIEIILLAGLIISGLFYLRNSTEAELLKRGQVTAQLFATMISDAVLSLDLATLDSLVQQTLSNDGIVYVRVRDASGLVLSEAGDDKALAAHFLANEDLKSTKDDDRLDIAYPVKAAETLFGVVEIGLATNQTKAIYADAQRWMFTIAATEILLVAVFGLVLGNFLTKQLALIRRAASRVASGDFGYQVEVRGRDEIAQTASSFNQMSRSLAAFATQALEAKRVAEEGQDYAETVLRDALNSMPQGVLIVTPDDKVSFMNTGYAELYDGSCLIEQKETKLEPVLSMMLSLQDDETESFKPVFIQERLEKLYDIEKNQQWQTRLKDGRQIMTSQRRMSDGGVVIVDNDITDLFEALARNQKLELELMQSNKMESLGTLAGGIAHEINTPVQFVGDNLRFLRGAFMSLTAFMSSITGPSVLSPGKLNKELDELDWDFLSEELPDAIAEALGGVDRIAMIVEAVRTYSHPESEHPTEEDLTKIIDNALTVSRNQWHSTADVDCSFEGDLSAVRCYPGKLSQVFINLVVNAAQAIAETSQISKGKIKILAERTAAGVEIRIEDNGPGIPEHLLNKVFDLFFTTKAPGSGTGQGLAICQSIIEKNHGGRLTVSSQIGVGTTFRVCLPK